MLGAVPEPVWGYLGYAFRYKKPTSQLARVKEGKESEAICIFWTIWRERKNAFFENKKESHLTACLFL